MNKQHPESSALDTMYQMQFAWTTSDLELKTAILQDLTPFQQKRYLKQLELEGYTPKQIQELRGSITTGK